MERQRQTLVCRNPHSLSAGALVVASICHGKPLQVEVRSFSDTFIILAPVAQRKLHKSTAGEGRSVG